MKTKIQTLRRGDGGASVLTSRLNPFLFGSRGRSPHLWNSMKSQGGARLLASRLLILLLALPAAVQAQFTYYTNADNTIIIYGTNNGAITIDGYIGGYTGSGGDAIPATINGLPVTHIGPDAFFQNFGLTSVTIPNSVTRIDDQAFYDCQNLTRVTIPSSVISIGSFTFGECFRLTRVVFMGNAPIASGIFLDNPATVVYYLPGTTGWSNTFAGYPTVMLDAPSQFGTTDDGFEYVSDNVKIIITGYIGSGGNVTIPPSINGLPVASIGNRAFATPYFFFSNLTSVMIPDSVTSIGDYAFYFYYTDLVSVYFKGDAPSIGINLIAGGNTTIYYLPNTTGWSNTFASLPTALWLPQVQTSDSNFGVKNHQFGFNISWASGQTVVVEASTNLSDWIPITTTTLASDTFYFSDPQLANLPVRFYRLKQLAP